ncbi:hypothetical protein O9929_08560 [Vibrio lentus]|nr:hypothetical protein [Vibrio lentus]
MFGITAPRKTQRPWSGQR